MTGSKINLNLFFDLNYSVKYLVLLFYLDCLIVVFFLAGLIGILLNYNFVILILSSECFIISSFLCFIFSGFLHNNLWESQVYSFILLCVVAAEMAVFLTGLVLFYNNHKF